MNIALLKPIMAAAGPVLREMGPQMLTGIVDNMIKNNQGKSAMSSNTHSSNPNTAYSRLSAGINRDKIEKMELDRREKVGDNRKERPNNVKVQAVDKENSRKIDKGEGIDVKKTAVSVTGGAIGTAIGGFVGSMAGSYVAEKAYENIVGKNKPQSSLEKEDKSNEVEKKSSFIQKEQKAKASDNNKRLFGFKW